MKRISEDGTEQQLDLGGLAYEPVVVAAGTPADAPSPVDGADESAGRVAASCVVFPGASTTQGIAIGEPTGDGIGRPIWVEDGVAVDDVKGDVIVIDDGWIDTGWYDGGYEGGSYDGGSYDYSYSGQWTMAVGDINGDGFEDSVLATYSWDAAGTYSAATYVVFGGSEQSVQLTNQGHNVYGWAVSAAGDVNGDGCDDLLVTTYDYSNGTSSTYLVFGGSDLATLEAAGGLVVAASGEGAYSYASAAGDLNGDGFADLRVSVYDYAAGTYAEYVVYGAAEGSQVQAQVASIFGDYPLGST